jgi:hypothetical protein
MRGSGVPAAGTGCGGDRRWNELIPESADDRVEDSPVGMFANSSTAIAARARVAILVIVGALFVVPVLVRATCSPSPSAPLRLNRGFERPPAKCLVPPPQDGSIANTPVDDERPVPDDRRVPIIDDSARVRPAERSPDPLRGPPSVSRS